MSKREALLEVVGTEHFQSDLVDSLLKRDSTTTLIVTKSEITIVTDKRNSQKKFNIKTDVE